ncbi:MAG: hypothetical protein HYS33_03670, partial [Acidobacteria bacterium]|nr:hypothetical protein [Acidobacteriota bacterium]
MKLSSRFEKWVSGFLGVVALVLLLNLVLPSGVRVGASRSPTPAANPARPGR